MISAIFFAGVAAYLIWDGTPIHHGLLAGAALWLIWRFKWIVLPAIVAQWLDRRD